MAATGRTVVSILQLVWRRKWWIVLPAVVTGVATSVATWYLLPVRYKSETAIALVPQKVSADYVHPTVSLPFTSRLHSISNVILSRTRLERIINQFHLYPDDRRKMVIEEVVERMRQDIGIQLLNGDSAGFRLSFVYPNPRDAMKVADQLSSLFIDESLQDLVLLAESADQFLEAQIEDMRRRIIDYEKKLDGLKRQTAGRLSQADVLEYEALQDTYKALLSKKAEARIAANLERRQIGETFKLLDPASLPDRPLGPSRSHVNLVGALTGLSLGLVIVGASSRRRTRPDETPQT